eukprot:8130302-Alexandrium_andersonii.AAC.1
MHYGPNKPKTTNPPYATSQIRTLHSAPRQSAILHSVIRRSAIRKSTLRASAVLQFAMRLSTILQSARLGNPLNFPNKLL